MYTLFEVLAGKINDSSNIYHESTLHQSIINHLNSLLNTRQGSLHHLPDYGLPDLDIIYQGLPNSITVFAKLLCKIIEIYEPRLAEVTVLYKSSNKNNCILNFEIRGKIKQSNHILLDTYFLSGGEVIIEAESNAY